MKWMEDRVEALDAHRQEDVQEASRAAAHNTARVSSLYNKGTSWGGVCTASVSSYSFSGIDALTKSIVPVRIRRNLFPRQLEVGCAEATVDIHEGNCSGETTMRRYKIQHLTHLPLNPNGQLHYCDPRCSRGSRQADGCLWSTIIVDLRCFSRCVGTISHCTGSRLRAGRVVVKCSPVC